jgi:hypothetical protein
MPNNNEIRQTDKAVLVKFGISSGPPAGVPLLV